MGCNGPKWGGVGASLALSFSLARACPASGRLILPQLSPKQKGKRSLMAFRGTYEHTVDDRGRVALPARYRHEFAEGVVLTLGEEGCIEAYTPGGFADMSDLAAAEPATTREGRRSRRRFDAQSWDTELDRQGRILIPAKFREAAGLEGPVMIAGRRECLEIWSPQRWERELREATTASSTGPEPRG